MESVYDHLSEVIRLWCRLPKDTYGPGRTLKRMWVDEWGVGEPYYTEGVRELIKLIYEDKFFSDCNGHTKLKYTMFNPNGGGIQTFRDLYKHLRPCGDA